MLTQVIQSSKTTWIAVAALLPALLFEAIGISYFIARGNPAVVAFESFDALIGGPRSPLGTFFQIIVVIGPLVALLLALVPTVSVRVRTEASNLVSTITIRGNLWNIAIIAISLVVLAILGTYVILENWQCIIGLKTSC